LDGLQLGAMLLAGWTLAAALGQLVSWMGPGFGDGSGKVPASDGSAAASGSVVAVLAAVTFVSLLRGRVRVALAAVLVAALVLAMATGEVRPAVALAVVGLPWILWTVLGVLVSSPAAALAVIALAVWGARRRRPAPRNDA
jgi:hypothetical protein